MGEFSLKNSRISGGLAASLLVALLVAGASLAGWLERLDQFIWDDFHRVARPAGQDERILIVEVTEEDIQRLGQWPLSDGLLARALTRLSDAQPAAIGLDIYRDLPVPPGTSELTEIWRKNPRIISVRHVGEGLGRSVPAPPPLRGGPQVGFNDVVLDRDGVVRRGLLYLDDEQGQTAASLALQLSQLYLAQFGHFATADPNDNEVLRLGLTSVPPLESQDGGYVGLDAAGYQLLLDFRGAHTAFPAVTLSALLEGQVEPERIAGKIVLIGLSAVSVNDFFNLPHLSSPQSGVASSGVTVHAHLTSQLVRLGLGESRPFRTPTRFQELLALLVLSLLGGALGLRAPSTLRFGVYAITGIAALWGCGILAFEAGWWLPIVAPAAGFLASAGLVTAFTSSQERSQRGLLMSLFSRHVSSEIAAQVWDHRDEFLEGGRPRSQRLQVTELFVDMKGYTAHAEKMDPQELMDWVNDFMEAMAQAVANHGGVVDDYFGDGIKAGFGVPFARTTTDEIERDALRAVECALAMEGSLRELNTKWRSRGRPTVGIRIGISSGTVVAGSLGAKDRLKYTVVGDTVVTAQRLESLDASDHDFDRDPCRILISESTQRLLDGSFLMTRSGEARLKGKDEPVTIYRVTGRIGEG